MDKIYFISGNKNKQREVEAVFEEFGIKDKLEFINMDLIEIQGTSEEIIEAKCNEAIKQDNTLQDKEFFVEDTSLHLSALHGFPGPYIKYFEEIGLENIVNIIHKLGNKFAKAITIIGHYKNGKINKIYGETAGSIEYPKYKDSYDGYKHFIRYNHVYAPEDLKSINEVYFGFDPIFQPLGSSLTFSEMTREDKYKIAHRTLAVKKMIETHIL